MEKTTQEGLIQEQKNAIPSVSPTAYNLPVNFNLAEYLAKLETERSVQTLVELRDDNEQPGNVRRGAANDLLNRGWGVPAQTINVNRTDISLKELPEAVQQHTDLLILSQKYVGKVPIEEWPAEIREFMNIPLIVDALPEGED